MGTTATALVQALRRIDRLEAARRRVSRTLNRCASGSELAEEFARQREELEKQLAHWRCVVSKAEAEGLKIWSRADFAPGDFVRYRGRWYEVLRVNRRSVTVPHPHAPGEDPDRAVVRRDGRNEWTWTIRYHDGITGRMSACEMNDQGPREHGG